ncbi:SWIM zinc finger family protein [Nocardiopsis sp. LOL_012]|uniref:SWIM zinc finger family protein n=1 Tax=Nocardiopsis sp. LOL_012 TaxID=3345409 RepID=UPI003A8A5865
MAKPASWPESGTVAAPTGTTSAVWGECKGSGAKPYLAAVHLDGAGGPAYKCSCPSRKIPCKHVLALLALWAQEDVHAREERPAWVADWLSGRAARQKKAEEGTTAPADPKRAAATLKAREEAVESGMRELRLWLDDQIEAGLAEAPKHGYDHWDRMAKRLVDAKAGAAASAVAALPAAVRSAHWPETLLERLSMLHLLVSAHGAGDALDAHTRAAVRSRIGIAVKADEVLAEGERVRDTWRVLGLRDAPTEDGQMTARRVWLRGEKTGRTALFLSFARAQEAPRTPFRSGTETEADLAFYPDGQRAVPAADTVARPAPPPTGTTIAEALDACAAALAADPWRDTWPVVLTGAVPAHDGRWHLADADGAALPLDTDTPWTLLAITGGHPCTVAAEWSPRDGLTAMTVWDREGRVHPL